MPGGKLLTPRLGAFALGVIGLLVILTALVVLPSSAGFGYDFRAYELAARRLASGVALYPPGTADAYNQGAYADLYLYPPPLAVLLIPITLLGTGAVTTWFVGRLILLALGCALLPVRREVRIATFGVAMLSFPVLYDLNLGNLSIVLFALSAVVWRWLDRPLGSVALAAILAVRYPFAVVLIGWLARGRPRSVAWVVIWGLVIIGLTLPIVGIAGYVDYVTILRGLGDISTGPHNLGLATTLEAIGVGQSVARFAVPVGIIFAVAVTVLAARRRDAEVALVAAFTSALLFGPFFHPHYLVGLLLPAALLADRGWWLALGLPLLGWLPGEILPVVAVVASLATLWAPSAAHEHGGRRVSEGEPPPRILGDERQQAGLLIGTGDDGLGAPAIENR